MTDSALINKAKKIKLLICDVDGVLTNGQVVLGSNHREFKAFNIKDGLGIRLLQRCGIVTAIITAKTSDAVRQRAESLGIDLLFQGISDKKAQYRALRQQLNIEDHHVAYIGDDWIDLPVMLEVGLSVAVADAHHEVTQRADYVTQAIGGAGAVRELADLLLKAQGTYDELLQEYLH